MTPPLRLWRRIDDSQQVWTGLYGSRFYRRNPDRADRAVDALESFLRYAGYRWPHRCRIVQETSTANPVARYCQTCHMPTPYAQLTDTAPTDWHPLN